MFPEGMQKEEEIALRLIAKENTRQVTTNMRQVTVLVRLSLREWEGNDVSEIVASVLQCSSRWNCGNVDEL